MTASTLHAPDAGVLAPSGSTLLAAVDSEWTKVRSVRSTMWSLLATVGIVLGLSALLCWAYVNRFDSMSIQDRFGFDPTLHSLRGVQLAQLATGVLGVLVIASEYSTGMIRTTFAAVPQRRTVLLSKALVFGAVTWVVGTIASLGGFLLGQAILSQKGVGVSLGDPGVLRAVLSGGIYLAAIGLLGFALGAILRRTAGAIAVLFGLVLVLPGLAQALPSPWNADISKYMPGQAGSAMLLVHPASDLLSPGTGLVVLVAWVVGLFAAALVLTHLRDA
ncbi:MAG: transporter permease [Actinomycetia bacterium]|nr:transporter permease [Actinomycetes bacterium]